MWLEGSNYVNNYEARHWNSKTGVGGQWVDFKDRIISQALGILVKREKEEVRVETAKYNCLYMLESAYNYCVIWILGWGGIELLRPWIWRVKSNYRGKEAFGSNNSVNISEI